MHLHLCQLKRCLPSLVFPDILRNLNHLFTALKLGRGRTTDGSFAILSLGKMYSSRDNPSR